MSTAGESQSQEAAVSTEASGSLLDQITTMMPRAVEKPRRDELIRSLVEESLKGTVKFDKNIGKTITNAIAAIDAAMSRQLAAIMHDPGFQVGGFVAGHASSGDELGNGCPTQDPGDEHQQAGTV